MPCPPQNSEVFGPFCREGALPNNRNIRNWLENKIVSFWKQGDSSSATRTSQCVICLLSFGLRDQRVTVNIVNILLVFGIGSFGWNGIYKKKSYICMQCWMSWSFTGFCTYCYQSTLLLIYSCKVFCKLTLQFDNIWGEYLHWLLLRLLIARKIQSFNKKILLKISGESASRPRRSDWTDPPPPFHPPALLRGEQVQMGFNEISQKLNSLFYF